MRRRNFIQGVAASAAWPLGARAQRPERARRIVVLMGSAETASARGWLTTFLHRLEELGWREHYNLFTQVQWWNDRPEQMRLWAADLIAGSPDVAVTFTNLALEVMKPIAGSVPIVFIGVGDPVGSGFVSSFAHPDGTEVFLLTRYDDVQAALKDSRLFKNITNARGKGLLESLGFGGMRNKN